MCCLFPPCVCHFYFPSPTPTGALHGRTLFSTHWRRSFASLVSFLLVFSAAGLCALQALGYLSTALSQPYSFPLSSISFSPLVFSFPLSRRLWAHGMRAHQAKAMPRAFQPLAPPPRLWPTLGARSSRHPRQCTKYLRLLKAGARCTCSMGTTLERGDLKRLSLPRCLGGGGGVGLGGPPGRVGRGGGGDGNCLPGAYPDRLATCTGRRGGAGRWWGRGGGRERGGAGQGGGSLQRMVQMCLLNRPHQDAGDLAATTFCFGLPPSAPLGRGVGGGGVEVGRDRHPKHIRHPPPPCFSGAAARHGVAASSSRHLAGGQCTRRPSPSPPTLPSAVDLPGRPRPRRARLLITPPDTAPPAPPVS